LTTLPQRAAIWYILSSKKKRKNPKLKNPLPQIKSNNRQKPNPYVNDIYTPILSALPSLLLLREPPSDCCLTVLLVDHTKKTTLPGRKCQRPLNQPGHDTPAGQTIKPASTHTPTRTGSSPALSGHANLAVDSAGKGQGFLELVHLWLGNEFSNKTKGEKL